MAKGGDRNQGGSDLSAKPERAFAEGQECQRSLGTAKEHLLADALRVWWLRNLAGESGGTSSFVSRANQGNAGVPDLVRARDMGQTTPRGSVGRTGDARKGGGSRSSARLCAAARGAFP